MALRPSDECMFSEWHREREEETGQRILQRICFAGTLWGRREANGDHELLTRYLQCMQFYGEDLYEINKTMKLPLNNKSH